MKIAVIGMGRVGAAVHGGLLPNKWKPDWACEVQPCPEGYDPVLLQGCDAAVICTPFSAIVTEAKKAFQANVRAIFSCTEDWKVGSWLKKRFAECYLPIHVEPHCGLAPGWVGDMARRIMRSFDTVDSVDLYAGALTESADNDYLYWPTWNVDGLIRELTEPCRIKVRGVIAEVPAQTGYRIVELDGKRYEAFYTAGGAEGFLEEPAAPNISYRSLRPCGHLDALRTLGVEGLRGLPCYTGPEKVLAAVTVKGWENGKPRATTEVWYFSSVAEATVAHIVSRVEAWAQKEARREDRTG